MSNHLYNQHTPKPTRKQNFVGIGGAVAVMLVAMAKASQIPFFMLMVSQPEFATSFGVALAWLFGYMAKEKV